MAGGGYNGGSFSEPVANINVTPLVDVMLVLLVIFMVTAPMLQQGVEVNLPKAATAPIAGSSEQVVVSITKNGDIFLGAGNKVPLSELPAKAKAIMEARREEDRKIYIKGDTELDYGRIMDVMSKIHEAGISQIGLISAAGSASEDETKSSGKQKK